MEQFQLPFQHGWHREIVFRLEAVSTLCDVYYYHPSGLKMRSMADLEAFFAANEHEGLTIENFTFAKQAIMNAHETVRIAEPRGPKQELQFLREDVKEYLTNYYPGVGVTTDSVNVMYRIRNFLVINVRKNLIDTKYPHFRFSNHIRAEMENEWKDTTAEVEQAPISLVYRTASEIFAPVARGGVPRTAALGRDDQRPSTSDNGAQRPRTAEGGEVSRARQRKQRFPRRVEGDRVQERLSPTPEIPGTSQSQGRASSPSEIPGTSLAQERVSSPLAIPSTSQSQARAPSPSEIPGTSQSQEHASSHLHTPSTHQSQGGPLPLTQSHRGLQGSQANNGSRTLPLPLAPGRHSSRPFPQSHQSPSSRPQLPSSSSSEPSRTLPPALPLSFQSQLIRRNSIVGLPHSVRQRRVPRTTETTETQQTPQTPGRVGRTGAPRATRAPRTRTTPRTRRVQEVLRVPVAPRPPRARRNMRSPTQARGRNLLGSQTETGREGLRQVLETDQGHPTDSGQTDDRSQVTQIATCPETSAVIPQPESTSPPQSDEDPDEDPNPRCPRNPVSPQSGFTSTETTDVGPGEEPKPRRPRHRLPHDILWESRRQTRHRKTRPGPQSSTRAITRVSRILRMAPGSNRPQMIRVTDTLVPATSASSRTQVTPIPSKPRARKVPSRAIAPALHAPPASSLPAESRQLQVPQDSQPREDLYSSPCPVQRKRIRSQPQTREESQTSQGSEKSRSSQGSRSKGPKTPEPSGKFLQSSSPQPSTSREESASPQTTTSRQESVSSQHSTPLQDLISPQMSTSRKTPVSIRPQSSLEDSAPTRPSTSRQRSSSPQQPTERPESTSHKPSISRKRPVSMRPPSPLEQVIPPRPSASRKRPVSMWPPSSLEDVLSSLQSTSRKRPISSETSSSGGDDNEGGDTGLGVPSSSDEDDNQDSHPPLNK